MTGTAATGTSIPPFQSVPPAPTPRQHAHRRRRIDPASGHALEILGHAIEYLSDEFVHEGGALDAHNAQVQAIQLLMALNRLVYMDCPEVPSFWERASSFLHLPLHHNHLL